MCGRIMFGSWADHGRIMGGSVPHCKWDLVLVDELPMEFHCDLQLKDRSLTVNGIASGAGRGVADGVLKEVSHEMRF